MRPHTYILPLIPLVCFVAHAQEAPPIDAQKYHEALLKHPHNTTVFSRFYDSWIDTQSIESLESFLKKRAETHGATDFIILARYQLQRGQDTNALASLNKAIETLSNDPALLLERANLLIRTLKFDDARKDLEAITKLDNPTLSIEASKLIGKSYLREGKPDAAIQAWEKILTNHPNNEDLLEDLVELASAAEQPEQALKYSEKLIAASTDPYKKALRLIRRGELLAKSNESDKAIALWSETLSQTGEGSWLEREILAFIEQSYRRLDRIDLLSAKFEELANAHPRRLVIHRELAKLEAASGNIDSAIGRFREVLRRSPGEAELREEFVRLLITSERFDDASAEIGKMLATTPNNPELHLRLAELAYQKAQLNPALDKKITSEEILKSLEKALEFLDPTEASGLRTANLMIRYGLEENGENLLKQLSTKPDATSAPAEALAAEYTRTKHTSKALEILTDLTKSKDAETVLRSANAMAPLTKAEIPFNILLTRLPDFPNNNPYIAALIQSSLAAKKPAKAIPSALILVRSSKLSSEIQESTKLASAVINAAEKSQDIISELSNIESRSHSETCLLATLLEIQKNHDKTDALFATTTEPALLRFHSSLLSVRGDFKAAIASLNRLAEFSADNSASYFKELSDLQLRAGDSKAALKTIEQWKIAAPTDKTPWTIASRLHRESGNSKEALETTRRALSRFSNDEDLTALLADLYQENGDQKEAERIFWKLYDQAPDTNAQSRWAARLAKLAHRYGKTEELKEKFIQRSRSNNQSIGPILALIEIARATQNQDAMLEHLYQALRIKSKDIDIRLQVASAEKQAGNIDKQMTLLNEGIDHDATGRIRTSLAQAYIDQGQVLKGMHMLRSINGQGASDSRFIESSANSIANSGLIPEAIQYLEESLPPKPDWRIRYLMAELLQKDGREDEATTILLSLMEEKDEIPGLIPNSNFVSLQQQKKNVSYYFQSLLSFVTQELYYGRRSNRSFSGQQRTLPGSIEELHFRSKIILAVITNIGNQTLSEKITSAKIDELQLIADIISCNSDNGIDYLALLDKHPTNAGLIQMIIQQGRLRNPNTGDYYPTHETLEIYDKLLKSNTLDQNLRSQIIINKIQADPKNTQSWDSFFSMLDIESKTPTNRNLHQLAYQLQNIIAQQRAEIPAKHLPKIKEILLKNAQASGISEQLSYYALFAEIDPWIEAVNKLTAEHQKRITDRVNNSQKITTTPAESLSRYGFSVQPPQYRSLPLTNINLSNLQTIASNKFDNFRSSSDRAFSAKEFIKHLDRFDSLVLRAWIAILADDKKAIQKALSAKPSAIEINDFAILKSYVDYEARRYPEACRNLILLTNSTTLNPYHSHWAKTTFLAVLSQMSADKRTEFLPKAREIIGFYSPPANIKSSLRHDSNYSALLSISQNLGFEDLVVKFTPPATPKQNPRKPVVSNNPSGKPVSISPNRKNPNQPKPRPQTAIDRFQQFSKEGKHVAAAHEFLNHVEAQKKQGYELSYIISNIKPSEEVRKEILSISDPGNNLSLTKRLRYAEICLAFNETDTALTLLRALAVERPFDSNINLQLAFSLPENELDLAANLLKKFSDSSGFYPILNEHNQRIHQSRNNATSLHYFNLITKFIEITDQGEIDYRATSEINGQIYYFLTGNNLINVPSIIKYDSSKSKETPDLIKHREISRRLVTAMRRHPLLAESAFRFSRAAEWITETSEIDELARKNLLIEAQQNSRNRYDSGNLNEFSSAKWICDRLKQVKSHNEIIPVEFIAAIEKHDPNLSALLKAYSTLKTTKDIATFWDSGAMYDDGYQTSNTFIQAAVLDKISTIPGATDFFISRIKNISQQEILNSRSHRSGESNHIPFIRAALASCKNQSDSTVHNLCKTIIHSLYGENFDFSFSNMDSNSQDYQIVSSANSILDSILNRQSLDPVTAIRVFQSFDSLRVPIQNYYWIQNIFQRSSDMNSEEMIKFLESLGFLKDTNEWKPIAYSIINHNYDQFSSKATLTITRQPLNENILQNFNYRSRNKEFIKLLENRKPQTFGNLITAAFFSGETEQRERLIIKAFKHAAPKLAKASPKQIEDFNLITSYLPADSIDILPAKLQAKIKERDADKIAETLIIIDLLFRQLEANPDQQPFNMLDNHILEIAQYDIEKATEIFLRAYSTYKKNLAHYPNEQVNIHQTYFDRFLRSLSSNRKISPTGTFKFYRAVINGPDGKNFGYASREQSIPYLYNIGSYFRSRQNSTIDKNAPEFLRPWLIANQLPEEYQNDALAAITCCVLYQQSSTPEPSKISAILEKTEGLSAKSKELIISCSHLTNMNEVKPENHELIFNQLKKILNDPVFSQNTRYQIALSAFQIEEFLMIPETAEVFSEIISNISKDDRSMVNLLPIDTISNISNKAIPAETIPHLKKISEAYWDNANSPKTGGHPSISEKQALSLFLFAVKSGDEKNTQFLLPKIRSVSVGNINVITKLILNDQFDLADELLASDADIYFSDDSFYHSIDLLEKLDTFTTKSKKSDQILRLECHLIRMMPISQYSGDLAAKLKSQIEQIYASYQKNTPQSPQVRSEILTTIHTSIGPAEPNLQKEICEVAALLDPKIVIKKWFEKYSDETRAGLPEEAPFKIICSAAMANLIDGKPELFISTCEALTKLLQQTTENDDYKLNPFTKSFIEPAFIATASAVTENKTKAFSEILPVLHNFIIELPKHSGLTNNELSSSLAIYDFISHWENQPNNTPELLKKIKLDQNQDLANRYDIPRRNFLFIERYSAINGINNLARYGDKPIQLATSILSRESIAPIYVTSFSWLDSMKNQSLQKEIKEFILNPPESISAAGKVFLKYHAAVDYISSFPEKIAAYQVILKEIPTDSYWHNLAINSKLQLTNAMISGNESKNEDIRAVFDSIDPKNIPESNKDFYERTLKELKNAESKTE